MSSGDFAAENLHPSSEQADVFIAQLAQNRDYKHHMERGKGGFRNI